MVDPLGVMVELVVSVGVIVGVAVSVTVNEEFSASTDAGVGVLVITGDWNKDGVAVFITTGDWTKAGVVETDRLARGG